MSCASRHADAYHTEETCLFQTPHDKQTEQAAGQRIKHSEYTAEQKTCDENSDQIDEQRIAEIHFIKRDNNHQIGKSQFDTGDSCIKRDKGFHVRKDQCQTGQHGS